VKEKCLAAMRMGIKTVIIPWKCQKDLVDIPQEYRDKLELIPVKTIDEVLDIALVNWKENKAQRKAKATLEAKELRKQKPKNIPPVAA